MLVCSAEAIGTLHPYQKMFLGHVSGHTHPYEPPARSCVDNEEVNGGQLGIARRHGVGFGQGFGKAITDDIGGLRHEIHHFLPFIGQ